MAKMAGFLQNEERGRRPITAPGPGDLPSVDRTPEAPTAAGLFLGQAPPLGMFDSFSLKSTQVDIKDLNPDLREATDIVRKFFDKNDLGAPLLTSGRRTELENRAAGSKGVSHVLSDAFDFRTEGVLSDTQKFDLMRELQAAGYNADPTPHGTAPHFHVHRSEGKRGAVLAARKAASEAVVAGL